MEFCGIHLATILQAVHEISLHGMSLKITILKLQPHPPGANELILLCTIKCIVMAWPNLSWCYVVISTFWIFLTAGLWILGWVGLWGFLWWAPSAKRKDHHRVSSGWSSVWHCSNTGLSSLQYEQISIILGVWPFCLTPLIFRSITFWRAYGWIIFPLLKLLSFFWLTYYCSIGLCFSVRV